MDELPERVLHAIGGADVVARLAGLSGSDFTSLMLAVARQRAAAQTPASLLRHYRGNRFVAPAGIGWQLLRAAEDALAAHLPPGTELVTLPPLAPLGTHAVLGPMSQDKVITTMRASEVAADPTSALALEAALRRQAAATDRPASDWPATDRPASDWPAAGRPPSDRPVGQVPASARPATDRPASARPASDRAVGQVPASDRPPTSRPVGQVPATGAPASDRPASGRAVGQVPASDRRAADWRATVRLAAFQRVVRAPRPAPGYLPHFSLLGMVTAGRDDGGHRFERETVAEHVRALVAGLAAAGLGRTQLALTPLSPAGEGIAAALLAGLTDAPVEVVLDCEREAGRGYYRDLCFKLNVAAESGWAEVGDGGFTDWIARLTGSAKERLLISGMGIDRVVMLASGSEG